MFVNNIFTPIYKSINQKENTKKSTLHINKQLMTDTVCFTGAINNSKKLIFDKLSPIEKKEFKSLVNYIFKDNKDVLTTLLGHKPTTLLYDSRFDKKLAAFNKYKKLLESKNIKFSIGKDIRGFDECYIFNLPKLKQTVEKNIQFYKLALGDKTLTKDEVVKMITKKNGLLYQTGGRHDILGVTLGYPAADSIIHHIECLTCGYGDRIAELEKYPEHAKSIARIRSFFEPSIINSAKKDFKEGRFKPSDQGYTEIISYVDLKPIKKKDRIFHSSPDCRCSSEYYMFWTYNDCEETRELVKEIKAGIKETKKKFKTPNDLLNYFLSN